MENKELEKYLSTEVMISRNIWKLLNDANGDDNAASIVWLIKKLLILYKRIVSGDTISVEGKEFILNKSTFKSVIEQEFYNISISDIEEEHKNGHRDGIDQKIK